MVGRLLNVEDEVDAGEALEEALRDDGFDVRLVRSAFAALEMINRWTPQVALVDIGLPGVDGFQLTETLRGDPRTCGLWIIAITGRRGENDRRHALECGMDMFISKPVDLDDLVDTLTRLTKSNELDL